MRSRRLPRFSPGSDLRKVENARPRSLDVSRGAFRSVVESEFARRRISGPTQPTAIILGAPGQSRNSSPP